MTEEEKIASYEDIAYNLEIISNNLHELRSSLDSTKQNINNNFKVNNSTIEEYNLNQALNKLNNIIENLDDYTLPSLYNKI